MLCSVCVPIGTAEQDLFPGALRIAEPFDLRDHLSRDFFSGAECLGHMRLDMFVARDSIIHRFSNQIAFSSVRLASNLWSASFAGIDDMVEQIDGVPKLLADFVGDGHDALALALFV